MEQVRDADRVIGSIEYVPGRDHWKAQSIHQPRPQVFYDENRARRWVVQLHAEETSGHTGTD